MGVDGGLMQVPNSTSALGVFIFHPPLSSPLLPHGPVVVCAANPPASITPVISRYICDSNQNNNTPRWIYNIFIP